MRIRASSSAVATPLDPRRPTRSSYARLATADATAALGIVSALCGILGAFDDGGDALFLLAAGAAATAASLAVRRKFSRNIRPAPARVLTSLALSWLVLVLLGTLVYLATGTIDRLDDAFVEAAAGFSTTALTTLDPSELTVPMQLWRAATQWLGGLVGVSIGVIALPLAHRGAYLPTHGSHTTPDQLAPNPTLARRRIGIVYGGLTLVLGSAYALAGMGALDSTVHAMTTVSTGGFSSHVDSFAGFGAAPKTVATIGMIFAGSSFFVIWWLLRGRTGPVWRSTELRLYLGLLIAGSSLVFLGGEGIGAGDAVFTTASALSTTGFAAGDWTVLDDAVLMVLLVLIGTGSMSGSAGGGLRVSRAWTLAGFASRELRRQLDPNSIVVVKQAGMPIDERTLERTTGYQIGHLGLCAVAAFLLAAGGLDVVGAIYTGISVISTHGPGVGAGPYGDLSSWSPAGRLLLTPFMFAGHLSILPLMLAVSSVFAGRKAVLRQGRRMTAKAVRR